MAQRDIQSERLISLPRLFATLLIIGFVAETLIMFLLPVMYGVLDTEHGLFRYTAAGHPGPIVVQPGQAATAGTSQGPPIGIADDSVYEEECIHLNPETRIVLYTDGLIEQYSPLDELFGTQRLVDAIEKQRQIPLAQLVHELQRKMLSWSGTARLGDDLSILAFEFAGLPARQLSSEHLSANQH